MRLACKLNRGYVMVAMMSCRPRICSADNIV